MYCKEHEEYINDGCCPDCPDANGCRQYEEIETKRIRMKPVRDSEFSKQMRNKFKTLFNLNDEKLDLMVDGLYSKALSIGESEISDALTEMVRKKATIYIEEKMTKKLDDLFETALNEEILTFSKDDKALRMKIEEKIIEKMNSFFKKRSGYSSSTTIDSITQKLVDERVNEALKELKAQTIERFNKETMKRMMSGMAKAIGEDKKLLSLLS